MPAHDKAPSNWTVSPIGRADLHAVARIHRAAFASRALSQLGPEVVRRYYEWQLTGPHDCVAVGVRKDGELVAFCFAGIFRGALSGFLAANRAYLSWRLVTRPWLVQNSLVRDRARLAVRSLRARRRQASKDRSPSEEQAAPRRFGCLSIAVHPRYEGHGLARLMFEVVDDEARRRGHRDISLTVDPSNHHAVAVYEHMGWRRDPEGPDWHGGMKRMLGS